MAAQGGRVNIVKIGTIRTAGLAKFQIQETASFCWTSPEPEVRKAHSFIRPDCRRRVVQMLTVDAINRRYGCDQVRVASKGYARPFSTKADFLSKRFTTRFAEILTV